MAFNDAPSLQRCGHCAVQLRKTLLTPLVFPPLQRFRQKWRNKATAWLRDANRPTRRQHRWMKQTRQDGGLGTGKGQTLRSVGKLSATPPKQTAHFSWHDRAPVGMHGSSIIKHQWDDRRLCILGTCMLLEIPKIPGYLARVHVYPCTHVGFQGCVGISIVGIQ